MTTKKCTKKRDISVKLSFCLLNVLISRHSLRRRCRQILRSLYYIWELSGVLLESKKEIFTYEYNDYGEDDFLIQIFRLFLLIHLGPVVRVFKYLFFKRINFSLLLLRWLNSVLAVCEYMSFAKSWHEEGCSSQAEIWQMKNILMTDLIGKIGCFRSFHCNMSDWIQH